MLKIEGQQGYGICKDERDPVALLVIIQDLTHNNNATKNATIAIVETDMDLYLSYQGKTESINEHF